MSSINSSIEMQNKNTEKVGDLSYSTHLLLRVVLCLAIVAGMVWFFNFNFLSTKSFYFIFMAPASVISFILITIAFYVRIFWHYKNNSHLISNSILFLVLLYCAMVLVDNFLGLNWHIGHFGIDAWKAEGSIPREISQISALFFLFLASSFFIRESKVNFKSLSVFFPLLHLLIILFCMITIVSYKYHQQLFSQFDITPMPLSTAVSFVFLWTAYINQYEKDLWPLKYFWGDSIQAVLVKITMISFLAVNIMDTLADFALPFLNKPIVVTTVILLKIIIISAVVYFLPKKIGSDYQRLQDELRERDERLKKLISWVPGMIYQFTQRSNGTFYVPFASDKITDIFGFEAVDVREDFAPIASVIYPEDLSNVMNAIEYSAKNLYPFNCEYRVQIPNQPIKWILTNSTPEKLPDASITWYGLATDITIRKNSDEEKARLATIVETSEDAIISIDLRGIVRSWNSGAERLFGYTAGESIGNSVSSLIIPVEQQNEEQGILNRLKNGERVQHLETLRLTKEQKKIDVSLSSSPIIDSQGKIIGAAKIIRDISEAKLFEKKLLLTNIELSKSKSIAEEANAAKSSFLSNMSHEIRTPMNAIIGMAELLSETNLDSTQKKYVEIFKKSGLNLLHIIDDILDISKIESKKIKIEKARFNLSDTVKEVVEIFKFKADEKNLSLIFDISEGTPEFIIGDDYRTKQILTNLIGNSIKFTKAGSVSIRVSRNIDQSKKGNLSFSVIDTGIGITKEQQNKLFQIYTQADSSTTKLYGGSGLGLTISKKLVELMGGEIWMDSLEGTGTKMFFTLECPENITSIEQINVIQPEIKNCNNQHNCRILLVDDAEINRILIQEYLKGTTYIITEAENGKIAVDKVKQNEFDIILMDMQMPVMDGYTATKEIREWEQQTNHAHIPIVAITAYALKDEQEKSIISGCDQHLSKPILKASLLELLDVCVQ
jgi:PAS domain S-box-containing protein